MSCDIETVEGGSRLFYMHTLPPESCPVASGEHHDNSRPADSTGRYSTGRLEETTTGWRNGTLRTAGQAAT